MPRLFLMLVSASLLLPGFVAAQVPTKVTGVVKELDVNVGTITVRPSRKGATEDETFSLLKKDIEVTGVNGEKSRLGAVAPGHTVLLKLDVAGDVEAIVVQPYVFLATVMDVDLKKRTVTLAREPNQTTRMAVADDARVRLAGREVYLREIKLGSQMSVSASLDGKTVLGLNLVSDPDGKLASKLYPRVKASRLPGSRWIGVVTEVDAAKSELNLTSPKTKGVPKSIPVIKDAFIQLVYGEVPMQKLPLNEIVKPANATALISAENQITHLLVKTPIERAKIKKLDAEGGQLTVEVDGSVKTFALRENIKVMNGNRVMRLGDLQPNLVVSLVLSLGREQLLAVDIRQFEY